MSKKTKSELEYAIKRRNIIRNPITRRQAKQQLLLDGLLSNVQAAIDSIPDATQRGLVQIYWDDAQTFERDNPKLVSLAQALELTDEQLDTMFIEASKL